MSSYPSPSNGARPFTSSARALVNLDPGDAMVGNSCASSLARFLVPHPLPRLGDGQNYSTSLILHFPCVLSFSQHVSPIDDVD